MTEILQETSFKKHKDRTLPIFDKYNSFNPKKANQILECGQSLWFHLKEHIQTKQQKLKLAEMYTCKDRFCLFCNWRRQMKYSKLIYSYLEALQSKKKLRYIFLTLTVKNCHIDDLKSTIQHMNKSFERMSRSVRWKNSILGFLRVLEYTIQKDNHDMVHPHFHILLAVAPGYFDTTKNLYLKKEDFSEMWKKALRVDYVPVVDIRIVKSNEKKDKTADASVVAEMCKYPLKDTDISKLSDENFEKLVLQLKNIRNINAGGILKGILKKTEKIDDDLIHIDDEDKPELWIILEKILYSYENINGKIN
ncbi:MAG: protein rep, partial [Rhodobacterales bacterium]|nr:protein rep [Rhodobacterales bacterium]